MAEYPLFRYLAEWMAELTFVFQSDLRLNLVTRGYHILLPRLFCRIMDTGQHHDAAFASPATPSRHFGGMDGGIDFSSFCRFKQHYSANIKA
jgi:hypothetical protein